LSASAKEVAVLPIRIIQKIPFWDSRFGQLTSLFYTAVWEKCLVNVVAAMFGNDPSVIIGHHQKHHHNKKSSIP
jgi:hypothetical protein